MKDPLEDVDRRQAIRVALLVALIVILILVLRPSLVVTVGLIVGLIVIVMLHEFGHFIAAKRCGMKVTEYFLGFGPRLWSFKRGETEYGVKALPLGGYVRIVGMSNLEQVDPEDEARTYRASTTGKRLIVVLAGVAVNLVLAFVLLFPWQWREGVPVGPSTTIAAAQSRSPADHAGILPGDAILAINGQRITRWAQIPAIVRASTEHRLVLTIERDGAQKSLVAVPRPRSSADHSGFLGVSPTESYRKLSFVGALGQSFVTLGQETRDSGRVLGHFFSPSGVREQVHNATHVGSGNGVSEADANRPMSVIGLVNVGSRVVHGDVWVFFFLLSSVNLFLALFNLIPLLPFDGGHAAIALYEGIASKARGHRVAVDYRRLMPVTAAVLALLLTVGVSIMFLDIHQIITGS